MNILEEFWYGNIEPAEYDISSSKEYKELLQLISRNEDKLLATMTDDQKELFTKYACVKGLYFLQSDCRAFSDSSGVRRFSSCNRNSRNFASRYRISPSACFSVIQCISFL